MLADKVIHLIKRHPRMLSRGVVLSALFIVICVAVQSQLAPEPPGSAEPDNPLLGKCTYLKSTNGTYYYTECSPCLRHVCGTFAVYRIMCCPDWKEHPTKKHICVKRRSNKDMTVTMMNDVSNNLFSKHINPQLERVMNNHDTTLFTVQNQSFYPTKGYFDVKFHIVIDKWVTQTVDSTSVLMYNGVSLNSLLHSTEYNNKLKITRYANGLIFVECARIVQPNILTSGGILHQIERPLEIHSNSEVHRATVRDALYYEFPYFYTTLPLMVRQMLNLTDQWYTVLVPSAAAWSEVRRRYAAQPEELAKIVRHVIMKGIICSGSIVGNWPERTQLGDTVQFGCAANHKFVTTLYRNCSFSRMDLMTGNGVIHVLHNCALLPTEVLSYNEVVGLVKKKYQKVGEFLNYPNLNSTIAEFDPEKDYFMVAVPMDSSLTSYIRNPRNYKFKDNQGFQNETIRYHILKLTRAQYRCMIRFPHGCLLQPQKYATSGKQDGIHQNASTFIIQSGANVQLYIENAKVYYQTIIGFNRGIIVFLDQVLNLPLHNFSNVLRSYGLDIPKVLLSRTKFKTSIAPRNNFGRTFLIPTEAAWKKFNNRKTIFRLKWAQRMLSDMEARQILTLHTIPRRIWSNYLREKEYSFFPSYHKSNLVFYKDNRGEIKVGYKGLSRSAWPRVVKEDINTDDGMIWLIDRVIYCPERLCPRRIKLAHRYPVTNVLACNKRLTPRLMDAYIMDVTNVRTLMERPNTPFYYNKSSTVCVAHYYKHHPHGHITEITKKKVA